MSSTSQRKSIELNIDHLGGLGDGIGRYQGKPVYVPYTYPGERVRALPGQPQAQLLEVLEASPQRQQPACMHFTHCGGCNLQHLSDTSYHAFKQGMLQRILQELGVESSALQPLIQTGQHSRRRVELKVSRRKKEIELGFFAPRSHELISLQQCPVMEAPLFAALPTLKDTLQQMKRPADVTALHLTLLDKGLDIGIAARSALTAEDRKKWSEQAKAQGWLRLYEQDGHHIFYDNDEASIRFGQVNVTLPPGAFLQATKAGELAITHRVTEYLKDCQHPVDLYAGCGTYSFPLLTQAKRITAYEGADIMIAAMHNALLKHRLADRMTAETRDLYRQPLTAKELQRYDGIVINPPRNGALPQVKQIAASGVEKVVMVSCNPRTFQRDANYLLQHGYRLLKATPIDQFYWSGHLEVVASFVKQTA